MTKRKVSSLSSSSSSSAGGQEGGGDHEVDASNLSIVKIARKTFPSGEENFRVLDKNSLRERVNMICPSQNMIKLYKTVKNCRSMASVLCMSIHFSSSEFQQVFPKALPMVEEFLRTCLELKKRVDSFSVYGERVIFTDNELEVFNAGSKPTQDVELLLCFAESCMKRMKCCYNLFQNTSTMMEMCSAESGSFRASLDFELKCCISAAEILARGRW